jgi:predicted transcriptional regulator
MPESSSFRIRPLQSKEELLQRVKVLSDELGVTQEQLGAGADPPLPQSTVHKILYGDRGVRYDEMEAFVSVLLDKISAFPGDKKVRDYAVPSKDTKSVSLDDTILNAVSLMRGGEFTQLRVDDPSGNRTGIITDEAILEVLLYPPKDLWGKGWISELAKKKIAGTKMTEDVPVIPADAPLGEAARSLIHHYACLVRDEEGLGIITRADLLKVFTAVS